MIDGLTRKKNNNAKKQTATDATTPFEIRNRPEIDRKIDKFIEDQGKEFQARIEATPKDYFVRSWILAKVRREEEREEYAQSVERTLNRPEHAEYKKQLEEYFQKVEDPDVRRKLTLREAGTNFRIQGVKLDRPNSPKLTP